MSKPDPTSWTEERPWGRFRVLLDSEFTKVKLIEVDPGKRLSYQSHQRRREFWTVVLGEASVTLDNREVRLGLGESIAIPQGSKHRLGNPSSDRKMSVIEVQTGSYFGEDDIERFEDDWGR